MIVRLLFIDYLTLIHHPFLKLLLLLLLFLLVVALSDFFEFGTWVLHVQAVYLIVLFLELDEDRIDFDSLVVHERNHVVRLVVEIARIAVLSLLLIVLGLIVHFFFSSVTHDVGILLFEVFKEAEDLRVLVVAHIKQLDLALLLL